MSKEPYPRSRVGEHVFAQAFRKGYERQRLRQPHTDNCDAEAGDWVGEMCDRPPRLCDCWCHLGESPGWLERRL